jgi:hypothetical protein
MKPGLIRRSRIRGELATGGRTGAVSPRVHSRRHGQMMTLFHPKTGVVRVKGVESVTNAVLHPWLQQELTAILADLPESPRCPRKSCRHSGRSGKLG